VAAPAPAAAAEGSRQCQKAQRKVAKEENWVTRAEATAERDRKARATCTTPAACERYDARLREIAKRKLRHEARLAKFRADAAKTCASG
jgi:hypothetical protein